MADTKHHIVSGLDLWAWRQAACQQAQAESIAASEVDWLLCELAGLDRLSLRLQSYRDVPALQLNVSLAKLSQLWRDRLIQRIPVQYLAGIAPWRQFVLHVSSAVLIPRPETEGLIDLAIATVQAENPDLGCGDWADLGTGSGAIAIGLADALPDATLHAVDTSIDALKVARLNAEQLGFSERIRFYHGTWFEPLAHLRGGLSGMVSNPPYIPTAMVAELQPEVARHEPHLALDGGTDGLDCIRHLIQAAPDYLVPGGIWLVEMMAGQGEAIAQLLNQHGAYVGIEIHLDLAGLDRYALARRR